MTLSGSSQTNSSDSASWLFCVAPMLDWTTAPCRTLFRLFSPHVRLYTEMVSTNAIIRGDAKKHLQHDKDMPCALQLGGGDSHALAHAVEIAQEYDYAEINLNVGCPSSKVKNNMIGACLMATPKKVAQCLRAMQKVSAVPVTVKHRLSIDELDERYVFDFVDCIVNESECRVFIVHARKAWLNGLSPKENRDIPPLRYDLVYELKNRFPECTIVLNGGVDSIDASKQHLKHLDGVMVGRAAYGNPALLSDSNVLFGESPRALEAILLEITNTLKLGLARKEPLWSYVRHLLGLFSGRAGARRYRRILSEAGRNPNASLDIWYQALEAVGKL